MRHDDMVDDVDTADNERDVDDANREGGDGGVDDDGNGHGDDNVELLSGAVVFVPVQPGYMVVAWPGLVCQRERHRHLHRRHLPDTWCVEAYAFPGRSCCLWMDFPRPISSQLNAGRVVRLTSVVGVAVASAHKDVIVMARAGT